MNQNILAYLWQMLSPDHDLLPKLEARNLWADTIEPNIGLACGKVLALCVHLLKAKKVLEIGTGSGYSTICLATAVKQYGGMILSLEQNEQLAKLAQKTFAEAGLTATITVKNANALNVLPNLTPPYDLVFQDSDIFIYRSLWRDCVRLLRSGGVLISHDALLMHHDVHNEVKKEMHAYNQMVMQDQDLFSAIVPVGDGLLVSVKR